MWLCTQHGFFSIVQKKPGEFHVRGRLRHDMENLLKLCGAEWPIIETKSGDYRYRIVCGQAVVSEIMAKLAVAIDYSNFKSRISSSICVGTPRSATSHSSSPPTRARWAVLACGSSSQRLTGGSRIGSSS